MPHIHTEKNQHDLTVTAYIIRTDTPEPKALVHMHKKLSRLLPIGGHVELLETPWQAIGHELEEESGYILDQLKIVQPVSRITHLSAVNQHPYLLSMNTHTISETHLHTDIEYGFVTDQDPRSALADGESVDLRWLTRAELVALDESVIYENTKEIYLFFFDEVLAHWDTVDTGEFA